MGVSGVPQVKDPSNSSTPLCTVLASIVCSHRSSRLVSRDGTCRMFGAAWWLLVPKVGLKYACSRVWQS